MPSLANAINADTSAALLDPGVEQVLDAALAQFEDIGIRRSTIEDVARRAGIDRVTVYRRVGSKDDVIQAVLTREARRLIDHVSITTSALPTLEDRIATGFATTIQEVRANALFNRMLALDGDTVLPRITTQATPLLTIGISAAVMLLEQAQADRLLDAVADPHAIAEVLVRLVHSFILTPHASVKLQTDAELEAFARTHIAPIATRNQLASLPRPNACGQTEAGLGVSIASSIGWRLPYVRHTARFTRPPSLPAETVPDESVGEVALGPSDALRWPEFTHRAQHPAVERTDPRGDISFIP